MIHVISTALNSPTRQKCLDSVRFQNYDLGFDHSYIESDPSVCALENFHRVAHNCGPGSILVSLDGDDWFSRADALSIVANAYEDPDVWMTYGSFQFADGRPGFAAPVVSDPRVERWTMTHLKTFRAGLFHKLGDAELKRDGKFRDLCWDLAVMLPMYEMAGPEHARLIADVTYVYNYANSFEHNATAEERVREREMVKEIRALPRRERLVSL